MRYLIFFIVFLSFSTDIKGGPQGHQGQFEDNDGQFLEDEEQRPLEKGRLINHSRQMRNILIIPTIDNYISR